MADSFGFGSVVLPPRIRDSLLDAGPGRYSWQRHTFEVVRLGRDFLTIVEIDPNDQPVIADAPAQRPPAPRAVAATITIGGVLTAGTLALVAALSVQNDAQRAVLICAAALAFVMAAVTAAFGEGA